jgi:hypothetical protein
MAVIALKYTLHFMNGGFFMLTSICQFMVLAIEEGLSAVFYKFFKWI